MPTLHSHTHCQAAQANASTQAWQRVCLSNRTIDSETHDRQEGQQLTFSRVDEKDPPDPCRESPPESFREVGLFCSIRC
jgi:hypothetical protein